MTEKTNESALAVKFSQAKAIVTPAAMEAAREAKIGRKLKPVTIDLERARAWQTENIARLLKYLHQNI